MAGKRSLIPLERIERTILLIRGHKVMLDVDLAKLYGVTTKALNQAVKRNLNRFPEDFMFQLSAEELSDLRSYLGASSLRSQIVTSNRGGRRYRPYAFTEQDVAMLSTVLRSRQAIRVNIEIMRAFVRLRQLLATHKELAEKLGALEKKIGVHDEQIQAIFEAIRQLMTPPEPRSRGERKGRPIRLRLIPFQSRPPFRPFGNSRKPVMAARRNDLESRSIWYIYNIRGGAWGVAREPK